MKKYAIYSIEERMLKMGLSEQSKDFIREIAQKSVIHALMLLDEIEKLNTLDSWKAVLCTI